MLGCHGAAQRHAATACPHARQLAQSYTHCCVRPTRIAAYGQRLTVGGQVGEEHAERAGGRLQRGPPHACTACAQHGRASHMACSCADAAPSSSPCAHMLKWAYRHGPAHLCQRSSPPVAPPPGRHEQSRGGKPPVRGGPGRMNWSIVKQHASQAGATASRPARLPPPPLTVLQPPANRLPSPRPQGSGSAAGGRCPVRPNGSGRSGAGRRPRRQPGAAAPHQPAPTSAGSRAGMNIGGKAVRGLEVWCRGMASQSAA